MPTKHPRVHVVLERPLFNDLRGLAKRSGLSISLEARALIREALKSAGYRTPKIYTGRHFGAFIGKYRGGRTPPDDLLAEQAHGGL